MALASKVNIKNNILVFVLPVLLQSFCELTLCPHWKRAELSLRSQLQNQNQNQYQSGFDDYDVLRTLLLALWCGRMCLAPAIASPSEAVTVTMGLQAIIGEIGNMFGVKNKAIL